MWILWVALIAMTIVVAVLLIKVHLMQKSAMEIEKSFSEKLIEDTNTLLDISSGDKYMRLLANSINCELRKLNCKRRLFQEGNTELNTAVTNMAHDLRTPLTAICGYLDLLDVEEKSEEVSRYLDIIRGRTELLSQLTEELFQYSIIIAASEEVVLEPVSLGAAIEDSVAAFYAALSEHGITPNISISQEKVIRNLDSSYLSRVLSNLMSNAIKYSAGDLDIALTPEGEITFTNTAPGMSGVQVGRLFDRFYTVESASRSTGLGLSIARTLVERMGGEISLKYENEKLSIKVCFLKE